MACITMHQLIPLDLGSGRTNSRLPCISRATMPRLAREVKYSISNILCENEQQLPTEFAIVSTD